MLVKDAIDTNGNLVKKLPWIDNEAIASIKNLYGNVYQIEFITGSKIKVKGDEELEQLKVPHTSKDRLHGSNYESPEDYKERMGAGKRTPSDHASHNFMRRYRATPD